MAVALVSLGPERLKKVRSAFASSPPLQTTESALPPAEAADDRDDELVKALLAELRTGNRLAGEASTLEPIGNLDRLDDLVRRYNAFEGRVSELLAEDELLDPRWRDEFLRDPEWHSPNVFPHTRDQLDGMARMIGHRVRLIDGMLRELRELAGSDDSPDVRLGPNLPMVLPRKLREGAEIMREAAVGCNDEGRVFSFGPARNPLDRELLRKREQTWTEEAEDLLGSANHPDLRRFSEAFGFEADGYCAIHNRVEAKLKVLSEVLDEMEKGGAGAIRMFPMEPTGHPVSGDRAAFKDFAHRFAGWLKSQEIAAPPDMTDVLGAEYEDEQRRDVAEGVISPQEYQRKVQPIADRREWVQRLRAEYQQEWRAEVARRFEWARGSGAMEREDFMALILVENPHDGDIRELVQRVERMAKRL
jgi:hypothetical protein